MKIFTHTQGRTGTAWLAAFFKANTDWECHHERLLPENYGQHTPDIKHMRMNNCYGGPSVRDFWVRKAALLPENYVETAHMLNKAGLWYHKELFGDVKLIHLQRPCHEVVGSMIKRGDYISHGNHWLWYLDPDYHLNLVDPSPFLEYGPIGLCAWYWTEMEARVPEDAITVSVKDLNNVGPAVELLSKCGVSVDTPSIPNRRNASNGQNLSNEMQDLIMKVSAITENFVNAA